MRMSKKVSRFKSLGFVFVCALVTFIDFAFGLMDTETDLLREGQWIFGFIFFFKDSFCALCMDC